MPEKMPEKMSEKREDARKHLVRLVRHVLGGPRASSAGPASPAGGFHVAVRPEGACVTRADAVMRVFPPSALTEAVSLGLFAEGRAAGTWQVLAPAMPFLKRAMTEPEVAFGGQHRVLEAAVAPMPEGPRPVTVNLAESPLAIMARLKEKSGAPFLSAEALEAGQRLHRDFTRAQLQPRMTMAFEPRLASRTRGEAGGAGDLADAAMAARTRVARAMEAIGPELCGVAIDVCGFEKGLETVERERQWPARSAKLMLRAALMALARHYAPPAAPRRRSHAWGAEGYRPDLDGNSRS
jgi:hypothetical protein